MSSRHRIRNAAAHVVATRMLSIGGTTSARADIVEIDETIACSYYFHCSDVFEVRCPQTSRYLCAKVENTAPFGAGENHTFYLSSIGTAPAAFSGVAAMEAIYAQDEDGACLTKPYTSTESALTAMVSVARDFSGLVANDGVEPYRLRAFCVSDEHGARDTEVTKKQDQ